MKSPDAALLRVLRAANVYAPLSELAALAGTNRGEVIARIDGLRAAGFDIDERPGLGYRLLSAPDRLIADDLWSRLVNCPLIREIVVFAETDSTNERATQLGRRGVASGLAIFAERQTAGRGRFGRRWESAAHLGLWFSLLLRPTFPVARWPRLTTWAAVALAAAIEQHLGLRADIKWPNDIFVGGRKVAGVLIETGLDDSQQPFAVVGIGVNVNQNLEDFPGDLAEKAASLRMATGRELDRPALAAAMLSELDRFFPAIDRHFERLRTEAGRRSLLVGRWVRVQSGSEAIEGVVEGLDDDGQLLLRTVETGLRTLSAGEVTVIGSGPAGDWRPPQ